jgi:hypothetical protein
MRGLKANTSPTTLGLSPKGCRVARYASTGWKAAMGCSGEMLPLSPSAPLALAASCETRNAHENSALYPHMERCAFAMQKEAVGGGGGAPKTDNTAGNGLRGGGEPPRTPNKKHAALSHRSHLAIARATSQGRKTGPRAQPPHKHAGEVERQGPKGGQRRVRLPRAPRALHPLLSCELDKVCFVCAPQSRAYETHTSQCVQRVHGLWEGGGGRRAYSPMSWKHLRPLVTQPPPLPPLAPPDE